MMRGLVFFCLFNWWGNWGLKFNLPKLTQLTSIQKIWDSSKDRSFNSKKKYSTPIAVPGYHYLPYCLLPHSKERAIRACLYHWGKMRIILKLFSFASSHHGRLTLVIVTAKAPQCWQNKKRECLFTSSFSVATEIFLHA